MSSIEGIDYREGFAGGCYKEGQPVCVTRDESFCDEDSWVTAHFLRGNGGHPLRYCSTSIERVFVGRCGDDFCANSSEGCPDALSFNPYDETCTIPLDLKDGSPVLYGRCGDDRCVWSRDDCLPGEDYIPQDASCTSDKVTIGACFAGFAFCSVSAESCNAPGQPFEPFLTHQELKEQTGIGCYLSQIPLEVAPTTAAPVASPIDHSTSAPTRPTGGSNSGLSGGAIAGLVVAAAMLAGIIIGLVAYRMGARSSNHQSKGTVATQKRPVKDLEVSDKIVPDDEELSC